MKSVLLKVVSFMVQYRHPIGTIVGGILIVSGYKDLGLWVQSFKS